MSQITCRALMLAGCAVAFAAGSRLDAQDAPAGPLHMTAFAVNLSGVGRARPQTLQIVIDTPADVPLDVFRRLTAACARPVSLYLDRFHAFTPGRKAAAQRCVIVLPAAARDAIGPEWIEDATAEADVVWAEPAVAQGRSSLEPADELEGRPGEWRWRPAAAVTSACS